MTLALSRCGRRIQRITSFEGGCRVETGCGFPQKGNHVDSWQMGCSKPAECKTVDPASSTYLATGEILSGRSIAQVPRLHLTSLQSCRSDELRISREKIDSLIAPFTLLAIHIQDDPLDGLLALQRHLVPIDFDVQLRVREDEVFPRFGPIAISCEHGAVRIQQASLDHDRFRDLAIGSTDGLAGDIALPDLGG